LTPFLDLHADPFERGEEFPPRARAASFSIDSNRRMASCWAWTPGPMFDLTLVSTMRTPSLPAMQ
jgi:hypothetical protein